MTFQELLECVKDFDWYISSGYGCIRSSVEDPNGEIEEKWGSAEVCPITACVYKRTGSFYPIEDYMFVAKTILGLTADIHGVASAADDFPEGLTPAQKVKRTRMLRAFGLEEEEPEVW